jgi:VIT1/CCC1 family predicted Fe2+/Mn2+ transporter
LDPAARAVLIILFGYFFVFGLAVGNFGTGIRHRAKFVAALIVLAVPMLPKLVLRKKIKTAGYHPSSQSLPAPREAE